MEEKKMPEVSGRYIEAKEVAELIRRALKSRWKDQRFSVRLERFAGGTAVDVTWTGGPVLADVEAIAGPFVGQGFDGMTDSTYRVGCWLLPNGLAVVAHKPATATDPEFVMDPPEKGAELVQFGLGFVHCRRTCAPGEYWAMVAAIEKETGWIVRHVVRSNELIPIHGIEVACNIGQDPDQAFISVEWGETGRMFTDLETAAPMHDLEIQLRGLYAPDSLPPIQ